MYKSEKTTYVVRNIPVSLWKKVRGKFLLDSSQHKSIGDKIIELLEGWVKDDK